MTVGTPDALQLHWSVQVFGRAWLTKPLGRTSSESAADDSRYGSTSAAPRSLRTASFSAISSMLSISATLPAQSGCSCVIAYQEPIAQSYQQLV